jgi:hypothetical protein
MPNSNHVVDRFLRKEAIEKKFKLTHCEYIALRTLASYCGPRDHYIVDKTTFARDAFMSRRNLYYTLKSLRAKGLISYDENVSTRNLYRLEIRLMQFYAEKKLSTGGATNSQPPEPCAMVAHSCAMVAQKPIESVQPLHPYTKTLKLKETKRDLASPPPVDNFKDEEVEEQRLNGAFPLQMHLDKLKGHITFATIKESNDAN